LAIGGCVLLALVVLGGMVWTTLVSVRLERTELESQRLKNYHDRLHLALARMERRVQSTLVRETNRPAYEYAPYIYLSDAWDGTGRRRDPGDVITASPIIEADLESWFILHFQVSPSQGWTSPQTSLHELTFLDGYDLPPVRSSQAAGVVLTALQRSLAPDQLAGLLAQAEKRDRANDPGASPEPADAHLASTPSEGDLEQPGAVQVPTQPQAQAGPSAAPGSPPPPPVVQQGTVDDGSEYAQRKRQTEQLLAQSKAAESCDPLTLALLNLKQPVGQTIAPAAEDVGEVVSVAPSQMTAVWLQLGEPPQRFLAYVRTVAVHGESVYQGFLLDWNGLQAGLCSEVGDLFPKARLVPVDSGPQGDRETLLTTLPARLEASPDDASPGSLLSAAGWTPMRRGLLLAWLAAIGVLAAVALGVRNLLAWAERRTQFAYAVSHELRTPLTTFRLYTDMLANGLVPAERRDEYLRTLNDESERLSQLVAGVLEYSRLEHDSARLSPATLTVDRLLESVRERYESQCRAADRQLVVEVNGLAGRSWRTDPDLTVQILGTLIDNACKYAREAGDPRIVLSASLAGSAVRTTPGDDTPEHDAQTQNIASGRLRLEVRDFGPGVSRRERRRVFKPFRRGHGCATNSAGIGLGLALAQRWAKLLGGKLELRGDRAHRPGACFCLTIPELPETTS